MNILVVDDELGLRHTLTLILQAEGHTVRAASDGAAALDRLAEAPAGSTPRSSTSSFPENPGSTSSGWSRPPRPTFRSSS